MVKTKLIYIIGSIIIGLVSVIGVFFILIATGIISTERTRLVLVSASAQKEYDGTALVCNEWSIADGALKEGHVITVSMVGNAVDAGEYENSYTVIVNDSVGADVTEDYEIEMNFGTLTVLKKAVRVRTASAEKMYDSTPLSNDGWELLSDYTLVEGHELTVTPTSIIVDAGEVPNEASAIVMEGERDVTHNYDIGYEYGTLTVHARALVIRSESASKMYDGKELIRENVISKSGLLENHELKVEFDASLTDAGEVENYFTATIYEGEKDVTYNYAIEKRFGTLTVRPRTIVLRSASASKEYDGEPLECHKYERVSALDILYEHTLVITYSGIQTEVGSSPNDFAQVLVGYYDEENEFVDVTPNYEIKLKTGTLTVKKPTPSVDSTKPNGSFDFIGESGGGGNSDSASIEVYSEEKTRLYLRNTSYGNYMGSGFLEGESYDKLIDDQYCYNYLFSILLEKANLPTNRVWIRSYTNYVLPYYLEMKMGGYEIPENDVTYFGDISEQYEVDYYPYDYIQFILEDSLYGVNLGKYTEAATQYEEFVREQYLQVPAQTRSYLEEIIEEEGFKANDASILYRVATYIQTAADYDLGYDRSLDYESDVVVSFLRDYKKGVCRHYAAAGTMLFRALGIPARYVTGFMINAKANEWTQVKDGHAWVEVYLSGYGWLQVEVTGGGDFGYDYGNGNGGGGGGNTQSEKEWKVKPATVAVQYDGTNSAVPTGKVAQFPYADKGYTYEMVASGEQTELGKGKSKIEKFYLYNASNELVYAYEDDVVLVNTANLNVTIEEGILHLYIRKLTFVSKSCDKIYDGTVLRSTQEWEWSGVLEDGHFLEGVEFTTKGIVNVGSIDNTFAVTLVDAEGNDITDLYLIERQLGKITVLPREIIVEAGSQVFNYVDGSKGYRCSEYKVYSEQNKDQPLADGEKVELRMTENSYIKEIGFVSNEIDLKTLTVKNAAGKDVTSNYIIKTKAGILILR